MFPFNDPSQDYQTHLQNLFANSQISAQEGSSDFNANKIGSTHQKMVSNSENMDEEKKIMHRDLERERRKLMASLITNLRSLLPLEFIKGRRTRADIVDEAVNYIEHLRGKISELHVKRDELKRLNLDSLSCQNNESSNIRSSSCVVINPYSGGLEIVIGSFCKEENFQLSGVMRVLLEESIEVESCASTRVNERMLHTIQTKVDDSRRIDIHALQQKLYQVCNSGSFGALSSLL